MEVDTLDVIEARAPEGMPPEPAQAGYASVNGLSMYYEIHGSGGEPLVLLHGSMGSMDMFRGLIPAFARTRQVIAMDQQAHGRTADVDRPLNYEQMAEDTAELMRQLGVGRADLFGFSMGGGIAMQLAIKYPEMVRKLVANVSYGNDAIYPQVTGMVTTYFTPEAFAGSPMEAEYKKIAPYPGNFPELVRKVQQLTRDAEGLPAEVVQAIKAPTMIIIGDSDIVQPENAVQLFRLRGGGVPGDFMPRPAAQLAILPGTSHIELIQRTEWLQSMVQAFLDAPMPGEK